MEEDSLNCEIPQQPTRFHGHPRDLLRRLSTEIHRQNESPPEESSEIELNLGLSLGGRFGVDPIEKNRLIRSSSIGGFATILSYEDLRTAFPPDSPLPRTVSLPAETEENRRKRKEVQSLRRLEAKKKRSDKQRNSNGRSAGIEEEKGKGFPAVLNGFSAASLVGGSLQGLNIDSRNGKSVGSVGSQGSSSSSVSDLENLSAQGMNNYTEARSPTSVQSLPERVNQNPTGAANQKPGKVGGGGGGGEEVEKKTPRLSKTKGEENGEVRETGRNMMEEMPCVSTRGCGPNGRRVEGFLYKFKKGEEVRIVCVCHGNFLSPAEFVKHAGGGDVQHPLKHIVVNTSSSFL